MSERLLSGSLGKEGPSSEKFLMTRRSYNCLLQEVERRKASLKETLKLSGEASSEGDKWHDEMVKNLVVEEMLRSRRVWEAELSLNSARIIGVPSQTETVELGHRVSARLPDDDGNPKEVHITLLGEMDVIFLGDIFDQKEEIIVSPQSPLGRSILGAKKGQTIFYKPGEKPIGVEIIDVGISPLVTEKDQKVEEK